VRVRAFLSFLLIIIQGFIHFITDSVRESDMLHDAIRESARRRMSYKVSDPSPSLKARPIKTRRDIFHCNLLRVLGQFD
jgi:hypothetical protein